MAPSTTKIPSDFEFVGGNVGLDFNNTFGGLRGNGSQERLISYSKLVLWSREAGLISQSEVAKLLHKAEKAGEEAAAVLERAYILREAIYGIFAALARNTQPAGSDLEKLNRELGQGTSGARVIVTPTGFGWEWCQEEEALDQMLGPVARAAATLLTSAERNFVRKCANATCRWLFIDTTKNHRRQWCMTTVCGNRDRVRRHRQRQSSKETL
jgi:predicted RNA-binding Zn ribbon-like protein